MGGKSTYMRQNALIVLLAYVGSYVPADKAIIGPVDKIFTRIGANDHLAKGQSTFMVEMSEMASILKHATPQSLILIDEIGRGTSTHDGIALAYACAVHLVEEIKAYTLFSTHYFELTELSQTHAMIKNVHMSVVMEGANVVFLYQLKEGAITKSYGLEVAKRAGFPKDVLVLAKQKLESLHQQTPILIIEKPSNESTQAQQIIKQLKKAHPDDLSPKEAHQFLYQLHELLTKVEIEVE